MKIEAAETTVSDVLAAIRDEFGASSFAVAGEAFGSASIEARVRPRIMIVDDEPLVIDVLRDFLSQDGYVDIVSTDNPIEAIALVWSLQPDVLLLDHHMTPVNGLEVLAELRAESELARLPIVILTAEADDAVRLRALELGATDFLNKPLKTPEFLARLRNILRAKADADRLQLIERQKRDLAERELLAAEAIQTKLYPKTAPRLAAPVDVAGASYSAGTGCGDYFDVFELSDGSVALVVGDVSGHGMPAALRMVETRAHLRSLVKYENDPGRILTALNQFMLREAAYGSDGGEQFVTLFLALINGSGRELVYASAGHAAYVVPEAKPALKLGSTGLPLGIADLPINDSEPVALDPGDVVVLTTDGVHETMGGSGRQFGVLRMLSTVHASRARPAQEIVSDLYMSVRQFGAGSEQQDDITIVVARIGHADGDKDH